MYFGKKSRIVSVIYDGRLVSALLYILFELANVLHFWTQWTMLMLPIFVHVLNMLFDII